MVTGSKKLELLRDILLEDEREEISNISGQVENIDKQINTRVELEPKVNPIIDQKIEDFQAKIPETMGPAITAALQKQMNESQDQVVDLLYPIIGKLIKKYIKREIQIIREKIDQQFHRTFSWKGWKMRIKAWFSGNKSSSMMISQLQAPALVEMFIIEKDSGLLKAHYSKEEKLDADMVAGMLTAISSFVEDAFDKGGQSLENIEYDDYKIQITSFKSFYIAVVISGIISAEFKGKLDTAVMDFAEKYLNTKKLSQKTENEDKSDPDHNLTSKLKNYLNESNL